MIVALVGSWLIIPVISESRLYSLDVRFQHTGYIGTAVASVICYKTMSQLLPALCLEIDEEKQLILNNGSDTGSGLHGAKVCIRTFHITHFLPDHAFVPEIIVNGSIKFICS